jgi:carotenoid cleavage dioxygenase-like enzyme
MSSHQQKLDRRSLIKILGTYSALGTIGSIIPWSAVLSGCAQDIQTEIQPENLGLIDDNTLPILDGDPSKAWWLRGNYAPIMDEYNTLDAGFSLEVIGALPPTLNGTLLRNGANPKNADSLFWFFGDGMLHSIQLSNGKALAYQRSWIKTPAITGEESGLLAGRANTNLIQHAGRLLALYEIAKPFEIHSKDLSAVGYHDFNGMLDSPMCAHPKIDPKTGEMWFIGTSVIPAELSCICINAMGNLIKKTKMSLDTMRMIHDFQLTENYVIILYLPMLLNPAIALGKSVFDWKPELGAKIGLMKRNEELSDTRWFEIEPSYVFHTFNAYEDGDKIILEACRLTPNQGSDLFTTQSTPTPWRWSFNINTSVVNEGPIGDLFTEFPTIDKRRQGMNYLYNYGLQIKESTENYPLHPHGIFKQNRISGKIEGWHLGESLQFDEALFIPDSKDSGEDEGWLLSVVYHRAEDRSELLVFNAQKPTTGPVARIILPSRIPFGFHGIWLPQS